MKLIRLAVFSVLSLFVIASLIGILLPAHVLVSRAVDISAPKDSVVGYLKDIEQWKSWMDGMQQASVQIQSAKQANLAGTEVTITNISDSTVISSWVSRNGGVQTSTVRMINDTIHKQTIVQWQFEQQLKWYPWERLGSMMNDKILGTMMEKNLNNLKSLVEKK
ncbi:MAG: SRPBCC family protein [Bacteroidota bacterium]